MIVWRFASQTCSSADALTLIPKKAREANVSPPTIPGYARDRLIITPTLKGRACVQESQMRSLATIICLAVMTTGIAFGSCTAPQNPIEAENCNPGSDPTQWSISGSGDSTIQGFATDISVNVGQTVSFKISTPATSYTIAIFRLGYYSGSGARKVATIQPSAKLPQKQPACLTNSTTKLYDCGNWALSASWPVPGTAASGIYFALLTRSDTGGTKPPRNASCRFSPPISPA